MQIYFYQRLKSTVKHLLNKFEYVSERSDYISSAKYCSSAIPFQINKRNLKSKNQLIINPGNGIFTLQLLSMILKKALARMQYSIS